MAGWILSHLLSHNPSKINPRHLYKTFLIIYLILAVIEAETESKFLSLVETEANPTTNYRPQIFALVETPRKEIVMYELPPGLLDSPENIELPFITANETTVYETCLTDEDYERLQAEARRDRNPYLFGRGATRPGSRLSRSSSLHVPAKVRHRLFASHNNTSTSEPRDCVGYVESCWSLATGSTPPPYASIDNRRKRTQAGYLDTVIHNITPHPSPEPSMMSISQVFQDSAVMLSESNHTSSNTLRPSSHLITSLNGLSLDTSTGQDVSMATIPPLPNSPEAPEVPLLPAILPRQPTPRPEREPEDRAHRRQRDNIVRFLASDGHMVDVNNVVINYNGEPANPDQPSSRPSRMSRRPRSRIEP